MKNLKYSTFFLYVLATLVFIIICAFGYRILKTTNFSINFDSTAHLHTPITIICIILSIILIIYWLFLIKKYEKDRAIIFDSKDELKLLDKYNPMISACISQDRNMHPRDIIAVLINLVNKKVLDMKVVMSYEENKKLYFLSKNIEFFANIENLNLLDQIEKLIIDLYFNEYDEIELETYTKELTNDECKMDKIQRLDKYVYRNLQLLGANREQMPEHFFGFNNIIFFTICISIILFVFYSMYLSGITIKTIAFFIISISILFILGRGMFEICCFAIYKLISFLIKGIGNIISISAHKLSNKELVTVIIEIISSSIISLILLAILFKQAFIIAIAILFAISYLITKTDNLMTKHSKIIYKDFYILKSIENKIKHSLLNERDIESQIVWNKYLAYSIALGITIVNEYPGKYNPLDEFDKLLYSLSDAFDKIVLFRRTYKLSRFK